MNARTGPPWWMGAATALGALVLKVLAFTWRVEQSGLDEQRRRLPGPVIYAFWHNRMLPLVHTHRGLGGAVLVSRSRDGELIARVLDRFGFVTARGSSTRAGLEGMQEMIARAAEGRVLGITPDGPLGPAEVLKPGTVLIASRTGLPVVPLATASSSAWVLRSWDRFRIPKPFSRVLVSCGEPLRVPAGLDEAGVEEWRARLERVLREHTAAVRAQAGETA